MAKITNTVRSTRTYAAIRAQRTRLAAQIGGMTNPIAQAAIREAIARYDAELATIPAKPVRAPVDRKVSAAKAWRTMLTRQIKGTRGKARAELLARIAHYDQVLQAAA